MTGPAQQNGNENLQRADLITTMSADEAFTILSLLPQNRPNRAERDPGEVSQMAISKLPAEAHFRTDVVIVLSFIIASRRELPEVRESAAERLRDLEPHVASALLHALRKPAGTPEQAFLDIVRVELVPAPLDPVDQESAEAIARLLFPPEGDEGVRPEASFRGLVRASHDNDLYVAAGLAALCAYSSDALVLLRTQFPSTRTNNLAA